MEEMFGSWVCPKCGIEYHFPLGIRIMTIEPEWDYCPKCMTYRQSEQKEKKLPSKFKVTDWLNVIEEVKQRVRQEVAKEIFEEIEKAYRHKDQHFMRDGMIDLEFRCVSEYRIKSLKDKFLPKEEQK